MKETLFYFFKDPILIISHTIRRTFVSIICLLLMLCTARAQHALMRSFNINDGLVSNQVRGFYQDSKGFIWIMTWEGLSRFDGHQIRNYTLADSLGHPMINAMIQGQDGRLYIAENDGTVDVIQNGEVVKSLRIKHEATINQFIPESSGRILAPSDGKGIYEFDEENFTTLNTAEIEVTVFDVVADEELFFVCGIRSGVMLHDHTFLRLWQDTVSDYSSIMKDTAGRIWVGTSNGLRWVDLSKSPSAQYGLTLTAFAQMPWSRWSIRDILQTSDGSIWVAAVGGLIQIKPDQSWRVYDRYDGLPSDYITSIFEDAAGFLWIGTDQGIAQLDMRNTIDIFAIPENLPNTTPGGILPTIDGGALIISGESSIYRVKLSQPLQSINLHSYGKAYEFLIVGNDTLVSTETERVKINGNNVQKWTHLPYSFALLSLDMPNGCIFSSSSDKITITCPNERYTDTTINDMIFALSSRVQNEVWVGTVNQGVHQALLKKNSLGHMYLEWNNFNAYLPEKTIRSLHVDAKRNIWIGTRYSGLVRLYQDSLNGNYKTQIFDRSDGFISDFIKSIDSDQDGNIWVGTHAGIEKLIQTEDGYRIFSFSRVHNFFATVVDIAVGPDNTLWCSTTSGIVRIEDRMYETAPPSEVYIMSVSTAKKALTYPLQELPFDLKYNQNFMDIEFSSNDHINGEQLKYSYRLIGSQDTAWSNPWPVHKVSYANLLPGNYRFEVRVLGWNEALGETTTYHFRILPPFWQRIWFIIFSIIALVGLLYKFYRYRISQLKRIQEVRDRIASDLHDEIGSSLTHVNILSEIGKKNSKSEDQPQQLFKRIGEEVQSSSEALDDIIWSVSSRADKTEDMISRMRRYASELFDVKGIVFSLQEDNLTEGQSIGLEVRRDFYLIYKELLRNVLRHAEATEVIVRIRGEGQWLWLEVSDNGHGFDPNEPTERHGLHSIKGRVSKWNGQLFIHSSPANGTLVNVGLPLKTGFSFRK